MSNHGYTKIQPLDSYKAQRRGGVGKSSAVVKEEDFVKYLYIASRHDYLLCFSNLGRLYWLRVYQLPMVSRIAKGKPIVNYLPLSDKETITAVLPVEAFDAEKQLQMCIGLLIDTGLEELLVGVVYSKQRQTYISQLIEMEGKVFDADKQLPMCTGRLNDTGLEELLEELRARLFSHSLA